MGDGVQVAEGDNLPKEGPTGAGRCCVGVNNHISGPDQFRFLLDMTYC